MSLVPSLGLAEIADQRKMWPLANEHLVGEVDDFSRFYNQNSIRKLNGKLIFCLKKKGFNKKAML